MAVQMEEGGDDDKPDIMVIFMMMMLMLVVVEVVAQCFVATHTYGMNSVEMLKNIIMIRLVSYHVLFKMIQEDFETHVTFIFPRHGRIYRNFGVVH